MVKAVWHGVVLAESEDTEMVEGNHYFPPESVNKTYFKPSEKTTHCYWKGNASYYDVEVNGETNRDAAWYYPAPMTKAENIKDYVAFWKGVEVS